MRILYDHQIFGMHRYGGISRYFAELAARLARRDDCDVTVLAPLHINEYLRGQTFTRGLFTGGIPRLGPLRRALNRAGRAGWVRTRRPDILHETYYAAAAPPPGARAVAVTVYDMVHELFPEAYPGEQVSARKAAAVRRADAVFCISHNTARDLVDILGVDEGKVHVVHLASGFTGAEARDAPRPLREPYLLYVGQRGAYKNFDGLLSALAANRTLGGWRLVAFGGGRFRDEERARIASLGLSDRVLYRQGDDTALAAHYHHADLFVYPSLYEGFGIPPLEAMTLGCPVAAAHASSLPEVVGDAAEMFDPADPSSISAALERVLTTPGRAGDLRHRGRERARLFTWETCAERTHAVYRLLTG